MIVGLSELLRRSAQDQQAEVTLAEEVDYLQRYVDIQKARFEERLRCHVDIPAALIDARVPSLLLQPLVENAIKHGIAQRVAGGAIRVTAAREGETLRLTVYNDGPPFAPDWEAQDAGVGLANLRNRLRIVHGEAASLVVRTLAEGGVEVVVTLPLGGIA